MPPASRAVVPPRGVEEAGVGDHQRVPRRGCMNGGLGGWVEGAFRAAGRGGGGIARAADAVAADAPRVEHRYGSGRRVRGCFVGRGGARVGLLSARIARPLHRGFIRRRRGLDGRELHVLDVVVRLRRLLRIVYRNVCLRNIHRIRRLWNLRVVGGHHDARAKVTPELVSRPARVVPLTRGCGRPRRVSRAVGLMHGRRLAAAAEDGRDPQLGARGRG